VPLSTKKTTKEDQAPGGSSAPSDKKYTETSAVSLSFRAVGGGGKRRQQQEKKKILQGMKRLDRVRACQDQKLEEGEDGVVLETAASSALFASLVDPQLTYHFRLVQTRTVTASAGTWAGNSNLDPTIAAEWSTIDSLFDEYKLVRARVTLLPIGFGSTVSGASLNAPYVGASFSLGRQGTTPGSLNSTLEPPDSRLVSLMPGFADAHYHFDTGDISSTFMWLNVSGTQTPYAGAYGQFQVYGQSVNTTDVLTYLLEMEVALRARS
jgi:hypothetical protein